MGILANIDFWKSRSFQLLVLAGLSVAAYGPAFDNGFISDDFINLELAEKLKTDSWALFQYPPLNFRMTSFLVYGMLQDSFGYRSEFYYAANLGLHFMNCLLLWRLLILLGREPKEAYLGALLFSVFQAPQEAVMWIAAMNETLLGFFALAMLVLWFKGRYLISACCYFLALFSKESAPILLLFVVLIHWYRRERMFTIQLTLLLLPTLIFAGTFLWTWQSNSMIRYDVYDVGLHAIPVLLRSLHLLLRPSFYVLLILLIASTRQSNTLVSVPKLLLWIMIPMLPYAFLTYSPYIPSRQVYMASIVLAAVMAFLVRRLPYSRLQVAFVAFFVIYNVGYMWLKNDPQYAKRAAPTRELLLLLMTHKPAPVLVQDFPYPVTEIARSTARLAPGWTPEMIRVNEPAETCMECVILRWDAATESYTGAW